MRKHPMIVFAVVAVAAAGLFTLGWEPVEQEFDMLRLKSFDRVVAEVAPDQNTVELNEDYIINPDDCIGCRICVTACPVDAISMTADNKAVIDQDLCIQCGICVASCPVQAIVTVGLENLALFGVAGEEEIPINADFKVH